MQARPRTTGTGLINQAVLLDMRQSKEHYHIWEILIHCKEEVHQDDFDGYVRWMSTHATVLEECRVQACSHVPGLLYNTDILLR